MSLDKNKKAISVAIKSLLRIEDGLARCWHRASGSTSADYSVRDNTSKLMDIGIIEILASIKIVGGHLENCSISLADIVPMGVNKSCFEFERTDANVYIPVPAGGTSARMK